MNKHRNDLERFFFLDGRTAWLIRGPDHPSLDRRTDHVEVKRLRDGEGAAVYSKRFLKRPNGVDYGYWTERETRFVGHFGGARMPQVVQPALLKFQAGGIERVDTQDAGPSLDNWQKLRGIREGRCVNAVELSRHSGMDRRNPGSMGGSDPDHPYSLGSGGIYRNDEVSLNSIALGRGVSLFDEAGEVALLLRACLKALHGLHTLGIIHCDIKADNLCLAYTGDPLGEGGIRLDYSQLRVIDFAFSVWPGVPGWDLKEYLPIDPNSPQADYVSPRFKQILLEDRRHCPPQAWRGLDYGVDLYALGVMLRKLLASRSLSQADRPEALETFLHGLADAWTQDYAQAAPAGELPHLQMIERIEAELRRCRPAWTVEDWAQSRLFVPYEVCRVQAARATPLTVLETAATPLAESDDDSGLRSKGKRGFGFGLTAFKRPRLLLALFAAGLILAIAWHFGADTLRGWRQTPALPLADGATETPATCPAPSVELLPQAASPVLTSQPSSLAFSPDGQLLAVGGQDGGVTLWQAADIAKPRKLNTRQQGSVKALAFSPDGQILVAGADKAVRRFDVISGQPLGTPLIGHGDKVIALGFTQDGQEFSSLASDGSLLRWEARSGHAAGQPVQGPAVTAAVFGPNLASFATGSNDGVVGIWRWDATHADSIHNADSIGEPMRGHGNSPVNALAFSPDGSLLISGGWDKTLRRWDARTGQPLGNPLEGHPQNLTALAFAPDGLRFASADLDGYLRVWDSRNGCLLAQTRHAEGITALAFGPAGQTLVSGGFDKTLRQWRVGAVKP